MLPGGLKIKPAKLRGIRSEGMLCSEPELGLGDEAGGLMELPDDAPAGESLSAYLGLDDHVLDIDLTPNRADCLSVRGLARELSALTGQSVSAPDMAPVAAVIDDQIDIELLSPEDCPCYIGSNHSRCRCQCTDSLVDGRSATAQRQFAAWDRSSMSPISCCWNWVSRCMPLIWPALKAVFQVRRAKRKETMRLLDGRDIELDEDMLLIAESARWSGAGRGDGRRTFRRTETARRIFCSNRPGFNPTVIVGRSRRLGLATESAHRFERGVDSGAASAGLANGPRP